MKNLECIDDSISNNEIMDMLGEKVIEEQILTQHDLEESTNCSDKKFEAEDLNSEKLLDECSEIAIQIENSFSLADTNFEFGVLEEETTMGDHAEDTKDEIISNMDDDSQRKCKICVEEVESLEALLYHYCFHFEQELLVKAASMSEGKTCLKCNRTFEQLDSVFILHFGLFHAKIIDILEEKNIGRFDISKPEKQTNTAEEEEIQELPKVMNAAQDMTGLSHKCQVCQKNGSAGRTLMCYCVHFLKEIRNIVEHRNLLKGLECTICGSTFANITVAVKHVGTTHGKVNILLKQKGFPEIPHLKSQKRKNQRNPQRKPQYLSKQTNIADRVANAYDYLRSTGAANKEPANLESVNTATTTTVKKVETVV